MSSYHFKNQSSMAPMPTHTQRESALRMKKVGPTLPLPAVVFFSPVLLSSGPPSVSLTKGSRLVGKNKQRFCSRTPEKKKNSRRATRKRLLKKELCKRESVFFILPTSVLLYRAFRVFFHAKEIDAFHPSPNFLTSPYNRVSKRASPPSQKGHRPPRVFFSVPDQKVSGLSRDPFSPNGIP